MSRRPSPRVGCRLLPWERPPDDARCRHGWEACGSSVASAGTTTQGCSAAVAPIIATMEAMTTTLQSRRWRPLSRPWRRCRPTTCQSRRWRPSSPPWRRCRPTTRRRRGSPDGGTRPSSPPWMRCRPTTQRRRGSPGGGTRHRDHGGDAAQRRDDDAPVQAVAPVIITTEEMPPNDATTTRQSRRWRPSSRPWRQCRPTTRQSRW